MLEGTTPIDTPKHNFKNFDEARRWAKDNIMGSYKNENTNADIVISNNTIKKYLSRKAVEQSINIDAHLSTLQILPELIKTSIIKEIHPDKNNDPHIKEIQRLYGTINYDGNTHPVKITVKVTQTQGNRAYSYEVFGNRKPE
jgi:hypothetical protein